MHSLPGSVEGAPKVVLAVAAPIEIAAVFQALNCPPQKVPLWTRMSVVPGLDLIHIGVGKANAAGAIGKLVSPNQDGMVLSVGIAGALPAPNNPRRFSLNPGDVIVATACVFADEGVLTTDGYMDVATIGFPIDPECHSTFSCHPEVLNRFDIPGVVSGGIATVSTCSGTDQLAMEIARRTSCYAESMEGAAVALAAKRLGLAWGEVRAISNYTGDRSTQAWNIDGALASLRRVLAQALG